MATPTLERFIPFRKRDVIEACVADERLAPGDREEFRAFCRLLEASFHHQFHERLEALKDAYVPFHAASATRRVHTYTDEERAECQRRLVAGLRELVEAANYEELTEADLVEALEEESLFRVRLHVDFDDFEEVIFFGRGAEHRTETIRRWAGLRTEEVDFVNYERVIVYVKFKPREHFEAQGRDELPFEPGSTMIKLFHSVPKADLEMLFPNSEVRMRTLDKLVIGVPAVVSGTVVAVTKLGTTFVLVWGFVAAWIGLRDREPEVTTAALVALGIALGSFGAFLWRQIDKFRNRRVRFMKALAENLYFKNLDNDTGVFFNLVDAAEEEEVKEALLAYFALVTADASMTPTEVDRWVEQWCARRLDCVVDFEIDDAVGKLARWDLVDVDDGGRLRAVPLPDAVGRLDRRWDALFQPG